MGHRLRAGVSVHYLSTFGKDGTTVRKLLALLLICGLCSLGCGDSKEKDKVKDKVKDKGGSTVTDKSNKPTTDKGVDKMNGKDKDDDKPPVTDKSKPESPIPDKDKAKDKGKDKDKNPTP
jgi:hypothetical protein